LRQKISNTPLVENISGWNRITSIAVGGLRSVGFDRHTDLLLVVSSQGRGVIDCLSGEKLARDDEEYYEGEEHLEAEGIGLLEGKIIQMTGLFGGGLPLTTEDGWSIKVVCLNWPIEEVLISPPDSYLYGSIHNRTDRFEKVLSDSCIRAVGFSHSGRSLVIATTSDVTIYGRLAQELHSHKKD
jgi:hypothetical protein